MPRAWAKITPVLAILSLIGAAIYLYPEVGDRIWNMLQARRRLVKQERKPAVTSEELCLAPGFYAEGAKAIGQPVSVGPAGHVADIGKSSATEGPWNRLDVAPPVAENSSSGETPASTTPTRPSVLPQVTLAIPAERVSGSTRNEQATGALQGSHSQERPPGAVTSQENDAVAARERYENRDKTAEAGEEWSANFSRILPHSTDSADLGDSAIPPLVPIERISQNSQAPGRANSASTYEVLPIQEGVARQITQKPVDQGSDPPLVAIVKNRWFSRERPERLPSVPKSAPRAAELPAPSHWTPEWPLYPSTGR